MAAAWTPATITSRIVSARVDDTYTYRVDDSCAMALFPTCICAVFRVNVHDDVAAAPASPMYTLHAESLPFGLLERIVIERDDDADEHEHEDRHGASSSSSSSASSDTITLKVYVDRTTGFRNTSARSLPITLRVCLDDEVAVDMDAFDADIVRAFRDTGHQMQFRMISAASIVNLRLEVSPPTAFPPPLRITFFGANAAPVADVRDYEAFKLAFAGAAPPRPRLLFPPLREAARRAAINRRLQHTPASSEPETAATESRK